MLFNEGVAVQYLQNLIIHLVELQIKINKANQKIIDEPKLTNNHITNIENDNMNITGGSQPCNINCYGRLIFLSLVYNL